MPSLKNFDPAFKSMAPVTVVGKNVSFGRVAAVTPDEDDQPYLTVIQNPGTNNAYYFTGTPNGVGTTTGTPNLLADFPRNVLVSLPGTQVGGTTTIWGKDQFGYPQTEAIAVTTAAGGGTTAGTKVFLSVGSVQHIEAGTGLGTLTIGYAVGTSATAKCLFGLTTKIGGTADCISVTWLNGTVSTPYTAPWASVAGSPNFTFSGTAVLNQGHTFYIRLRPTWDNTSQATYLDNAYTAGSNFG